MDGRDITGNNDRTEDEIEESAGGPLANAILGANVAGGAGGVEGTLAGAVLGEAAAEDAIKMPTDQDLPPINVDNLDTFRSPDAQKGSSEANG